MQTNPVENFAGITTGSFINQKPFLDHLAIIIAEIYFESYKKSQDETKIGKDSEYQSGM